MATISLRGLTKVYATGVIGAGRAGPRRRRRASSSCLSGPRAAARRRRCGWSRAWSGSPRARSASATAWSTTCRPGIVTSPWSSRTTRSTRTCRSIRTSASRWRTRRSRRPNETGGSFGRSGARPGGVARPQAAAAIRRAAAAGGDGAGDRALACGVPDGRAAVQPGRQAPGADALGGAAGAPVDRGRHAVRHARPDRGDDDGRPGSGAAATACCSSTARRGRCTLRPRNVFVASFIGSPAMNLYEATLEGSTIWARRWCSARSGWPCPLRSPPASRPTWAARSSSASAREDLTRCPGAQSAPGLVADVRFVEVLGSEQHVFFWIDATPAGGPAALAGVRADGHPRGQRAQRRGPARPQRPALRDQGRRPRHVRRRPGPPAFLRPRHRPRDCGLTTEVRLTPFWRAGRKIG